MKNGNRQSAIGNRELDRREALAAMGVGAFAAYGVGTPAWERFRQLAASRQQPAAFFSASERQLLGTIVDMVIPRDAKSGSATDAGSLDYMDFVVGDSSPRSQQAWRDGLAWFDAESQRRFTKPFGQASEQERGQILDAVAWPARAAAELRPQVDFFNRLRDLTATAFFSSHMGIEDLNYMGGVFNPNWQGAPPEALTELGVSYAEWDRKYGRAAAQPAQPARGSRRTAHE